MFDLPLIKAKAKLVLSLTTWVQSVERHHLSPSSTYIIFPMWNGNSENESLPVFYLNLFLLGIC